MELVNPYYIIFIGVIQAVFDFVCWKISGIKAVTVTNFILAIIGPSLWLLGIQNMPLDEFILSWSEYFIKYLMNIINGFIASIGNIPLSYFFHEITREKYSVDFY